MEHSAFIRDMCDMLKPTIDSVVRYMKLTPGPNSSLKALKHVLETHTYFCHFCFEQRVFENVGINRDITPIGSKSEVVTEEELKSTIVVDPDEDGLSSSSSISSCSSRSLSEEDQIQTNDFMGEVKDDYEQNGRLEEVKTDPGPETDSADKGDSSNMKTALRIRCPVPGCGKIFAKTYLNYHNASAHKILPKDFIGFECRTCDKLFLYDTQYRAHMAARHGGKKNFACHVPGCGKTYAQSNLLKRHLLIVHKIGDGKHPCTHCTESFPSRSGLERHLYNAHDLGLKFTCEICKKIFCSKVNLRSHMALHFDNKIQCEFCEEIFKNKTYLARHIRLTHSAKVKCSVCGKTFAASSLRHHQSVKHSNNPVGPRKFKCQLDGCHKSFNKREHMLKHMHCRRHAKK